MADKGKIFICLEGGLVQGVSPTAACLPVLSDTEKVLKLILEVASQETKLADRR